MPGLPRTVVGVYDHPADPDVPGLKSVSVGDNFLSSTARKITGWANEGAALLDSLDPIP